MIAALAAGQAEGGDSRSGRLQSAAVVVADPRPGNSRRPDQVTTDINVCEHPTPVAELRRVWNSISQSLGYRELRRFEGNDVWQLRVMLHAVGHYRAEVAEIPLDDASRSYTADLVDAVDAFREAEGLSTRTAGLVDGHFIEHVWRAIEAAGKTRQVRAAIGEATLVRR